MPQSLKSGGPQRSDSEMLDQLQRETFNYFRDEANPTNGLLPDKTQPGSPSSIATMGMTLSAYVVASEREWLPRAEVIDRTLTILRFFRSSHQGTEANATGYKGFYYHFIDMQTGERSWQSELSTVDSALFLAGVLTAANYFGGDNQAENEIRELADFLFRRVDWQWALNGGTTITHGWTPESGFLPYRWDLGYTEAIILYVLALGSPTFPIDAKGYLEWTSTFETQTNYGIEYIYAGPLFIHQMSHLWLDFRGIHDEVNRKNGIDYFENSRRATLVQQQYGIENPMGFEHYHQYGWGWTASDGPGPETLEVKGIERQFFGYVARGAPFGPDDGTVSPWAVVASLPFAPEIVIDTVRHAIEKLELNDRAPYGFHASFNATYPDTTRNKRGWVSPWVFGLNQGPIVLMIENYQTGLLWKTMRKCNYISDGLERAGFRPTESR